MTEALEFLAVLSAALLIGAVGPAARSAHRTQRRSNRFLSVAAAGSLDRYRVQ